MRLILCSEQNNKDMDSNLVKATAKGVLALVTIFTGKKILDNAKSDYDRYKNPPKFPNK